MKDKLELDRKIFKALSSEIRINILKILNERRTTVTKLSKVLNLSKSTVHKHLSKLIESGLIVKSKRNPSSKLVYYELSENGISLMGGDVKRTMLLLSSATIGFAVGIYELANYIIGKTIVEEIVYLEPPPTVVVHEPAHLFIGLISISVGILLICYWKLQKKGRGIRLK